MTKLSLFGKSAYVPLRSIYEKSAKNKEQVFQNLMHHINIQLLKECHTTLDGNKAVGLDKVTKEDYHKNLESNLELLVAKIRRGKYEAKASRIVEIPKADGSKRPLAIGCYEDKLVQMAVAKILEAITLFNS